MQVSMLALKGFDDTALGGRIRRGVRFSTSERHATVLERNGVAVTDRVHLADVGKSSDDGAGQLSSASHQAPASPRRTRNRSIGGGSQVSDAEPSW